MVGLGIDAVRSVPGAVVRHVAALEVVGLDRLLQAVLVDAPVGVILMIHPKLRFKKSINQFINVQKINNSIIVEDSQLTPSGLFQMSTHWPSTFFSPMKAS